MFVITSVIVPSNNALDYTPIRSVFSPEQRLRQTVYGIQTIRKTTNEKIMLIECSNHLTKKVDLSELKDLVDVFLDFSEDNDILLQCNSPNKSWAEINMLNKAIEYLPDEERIYKLSGRYHLLDNFDISKFNNGDISARLFIDDLPLRCCGVVYSMRDKNTYRNFTSSCISKYERNRHISMEDMLYRWAINKDFNVLNTIEASGLIAVSGTKELY